jgi:hypothetical protein
MVRGNSVDGGGDERRLADRLLDRKYFLKVIATWLRKANPRERAMIRIELS